MSTAKLVKRARVVSFYTGLSRLLGLLREVGMGHFFGTTLAKSAFDVAFRIPNLFRRLFGEGALSAAFIPVFREVLERKGNVEAGRLAARVAGLLGLFLALVVAAGWGVVTWLQHSGALGPKVIMTLSLLRIMLPYTLFICLVALAMGILNSFKHFALPAATPVILNLVWIGCLVGVFACLPDDPQIRIRAVAWSVLVAGAIQLVVQLPLLRALGIPLCPRLSWHDPHVRRILVLMLPAALGAGVHQINVLVDGVLALWIGSWAPAALTYAERLVYLPLGLFATAMGTVLLPTFSQHVARGETGPMLVAIRQSVLLLLLVMIPAAAGLAVLATPIVRLIFVWDGGVFDERSVCLTARALRFYAPGLVVFSFYKVMAPAFHARQQMRTPARVGAWCVLLNLLLNVAFVLTWPLYYRHAGLACATVIASMVNGLWLAFIMTREVGNPGWRQLLTRCLHMVLCAEVMVCVAVVVATSTLGLFGYQKWGQCASVLLAIVAGAGAYAALARVVCAPEWRALTDRDSSGDGVGLDVSGGSA